MNIKSIGGAALIACGTAFNLLAQNHPTVQSLIKNDQIGFLENKGQVVDQRGNHRNDVKYILSSNGFKLILKENGFSYEIYTIEEKKFNISEATGCPAYQPVKTYQGPAEAIIRTNRVDVELKDANHHPEIEAGNKNQFFSNYYLPHTSAQGSKVYSYSKITYRNVYPHIDFVFEIKDANKLKYDIVVHPGGRLDDIKMIYHGINNLKLQSNQLTLTTALGKVSEEIPLSYVKETGQKVNVQYKINGNTSGFTGNFSKLKGKTIIVDPLLAWATFYGGSLDEYGVTEDIDHYGNIYIGGYTYTTSGIATTGSYQTTNAGPADGYIVKFNGKGVRQWATYYGGDKQDYLNSLKIGTAGDGYIGGITSSASAIASNGAFQTSIGGGEDAFLMKFDLKTGARQWATYYGNTGDDDGMNLAVDPSGAIYLLGHTTSTTGISTPGSYKPNLGGDSTIPGSFDLFIVKFSKSGDREWATYYGGNGNETAGFLAFDNFNNMFIVGRTNSTSGIASTNAAQPYLFGGIDAFVVKFNKDGNRSWSTYCGGEKNEFAPTIAVDTRGNINIAGMTLSESGITTKGSYQPLYGGGSADGFLIHYDSTGRVQWSTYYGGDQYDYSSAIAVDDSDNIFIAGRAASTSGISTTGAYQENFGGGTGDGFIAKFNNAGERQWGTYYGSTDNDGISFLCLDRFNNLYALGSTQSKDGIATPGAFQLSNASNTGRNDAFLVKFNKYHRDIASDNLQIHGKSFCDNVPDSIFLTVYNGGLDSISSFEIHYSISGTAGNTYKYSNILRSADSTGRLFLDRISFVAGTNTLKIWTMNLNAGKDENPTNDTLVYQVNIDVPNADFTVKDSDPLKFLFTPSDLSGSGYYWLFGDGESSALKAPSHTYKTAGSYTVKLTITNANGCESTTSELLEVQSSGLDDQQSEMRFSTYPNPFKSSFLIQAMAGVTYGSIDIYTIMGKLIYSQSLDLAQKKEIDLSKAAKGLYLLKITDENGVSYTQKIFKED